MGERKPVTDDGRENGGCFDCFCLGDISFGVARRHVSLFRVPDGETGLVSSGSACAEIGGRLFPW